MPRYLKQGQYKEALEEILETLGYYKHWNNETKEWELVESGKLDEHMEECIGCKGCKYEIQEAIYTARASLGLTVPREKCEFCGALDQVYWYEGDPHPTSVMSCHSCGQVITDHKFVEVPADEADCQ